MRRTRATILAALAGGALAAGIGACGGDDSSSGGGLSRSELAAKANPLCEKYATRAASLPRDRSSLQGKVNYANKFAKVFEDLTAELRTLKPAGDVKADWDAFLAKFGAVGPLMARLTRTASTGDRAATLAAVQEFRTLQSDADQIGKRLGATKCAAPG